MSNEGHAAETLTCINCNTEIIKSEPFILCSDCGNVLCPSCASANVRSATISHTTSYVVARVTSSMEIKYFRCVECARKYVEYLNYNRQKDKGYRKKYWRNFSIIMVTVILLFLSPEIYYAFQGNAQVPENFWSTCLLGIVALGFIFGILGASTVKSIQIKKKDMPAHLADYEQLAYLDKIRPTLCPVCGKNVENDLFKTQKELDRRRGVSFQEKFARFGEKYTVRDYLICSKCGYSDPASIAWGLRMHVKRFGYSSLEGTIYENEAKHAIRFLYGK